MFTPRVVEDRRALSATALKALVALFPKRELLVEPKVEPAPAAREGNTEQASEFKAW